MKARVSSPSKTTLLARHVRAGKVYRREDLAPYSTSVDRELRQLVDQGTLHKLAQGLYYKPKKNVFGEVPPDETELLAAFLKDRNFLSFNPSVYNSLRLGTTQLYNKTVVYNHKRHGEFVLERRRYDFRMKPRFPRSNQVTPEYLLVDMLNNLDGLAEDRESVLAAVQRKLATFDRQKLQKSLEQYGSAATKRLMKRWQLSESPASQGQAA